MQPLSGELVQGGSQLGMGVPQWGGQILGWTPGDEAGQKVLCVWVRGVVGSTAMEVQYLGACL